MKYREAVEAVREQTRIMRSHPCTEESKPMRSPQSHLDGTGAQKSCLSQHWDLGTGPPPLYREFPLLPYDEMCDNCKARHAAFQTRRALRMKLGGAKRAVEAAGKRLARERS